MATKQVVKDKSSLREECCKATGCIRNGWRRDTAQAEVWVEAEGLCVLKSES